jgi:radical SAM protein with 4Fe4S-binding SPASM domain
MKITEIKFDFKLDQKMISGLLAIINLAFFISGILNFRGFTYSENYGIKFSLYPPYTTFDLCYVFGMEVLFLILNFMAFLGFAVKKPWGWYCSFTFFLINFLKSLCNFSVMFWFWLGAPYINEFEWILLSPLFVAIVSILLLFDKNLLSIINHEKRTKIIAWLSLIAFIIFVSYYRSSINHAMTSNVTSSTYTLTGCNWELTLSCTLSCMHCGSRAGKARPNELSLDECFSVAEELIGMGCKDLTMIGGEVFLFTGWDRLAEYLVDKGVLVNIVTNGYKVGESEAEQIKRAKLRNVGVSVDGMEANHNRIRGRHDAFQGIRDTLNLLAKEGVMVTVITSLMKFNCADLEDLYIFLVEHNVQAWQLQLVSPMGNMVNQDEFTVTPEQVRQVIDFIRDKNRDRRMVVVAADSIGYFDDNEAYIRGRSSPICCWGGCSAGISNIFIDSVGNVKGCGALYSDTFIEGNVRNTPLADIWNNTSAFSYNRKFTTDLLSGKCEGCEVGDICKGGCRSSNYFATNNLYSNAFCCQKR